MIKLFDINEGRVMITPECLLIPEFKAVIDAYPDDPIPALSYVYFMKYPQSPYSNMPDNIKQDTVSRDIGGDFSFEDDVIIAAMNKAELLYTSAIQRLYEGSKKNIDKLSEYLATNAIEGGRDGNLGEIYRIQIGLPKMFESHKKLEQMRDEEIKTALRGAAKQGRY